MNALVVAPFADRTGGRFRGWAPRIRRRLAGREAGLAVLLAGLTLRRWAAALDTSVRGLVVGSAGVFVALAAAGAAAAWRWYPAGTAVSNGPVESALLGLSVSLWAIAAAFGIFVGHATVVPPSLGFLRTLPVSPRQAAGAAALPVVAAGAGAVAVAGPLAIRATTALTGRGPGHAIALLGLAAVSGMALGMILQRSAAGLLTGAGAGSLRLTTAYLGWCATVAVSLTAPLPLLRWFGDAAGLLVLAPLGWPLAWWALVDPQPTVTAGALAVSVALVALAVRDRGARPDPARARVTVRPLVAGRPFLVARVELRRLVRNPRTLEALVVAGFFGLVLALTGGWLARRIPGAPSPTVIALLGAQIGAAPAALARGVSDRRRPVEATLGIGAGEHVVALAAAALGLAALGSLPALLAALALLPASAALGWLVVLPALVAVAVVVSWGLTPELGNGSAEGGAVLVHAAASTALLALGDHLPAVAVSAGAVVLPFAAVAAAVTVERAHRRPR